jgi:hypothetical protein
MQILWPAGQGLVARECCEKDRADIDASGLCDRQSAPRPYVEPSAVVARTVAKQPAQRHWFGW